MNGTVSNFNLYGIKLDSKCHIEKVQALSNGRDGLYCSSGLITGNRVDDNATLTDDIDTWSGIFAGADSVVSNDMVAKNRGHGIAGVGLVIDNVIYENGIGINVITGNNSGGAQVDGGKSRGANICNPGVCP
jgi:hypothetical protein